MPLKNGRFSLQETKFVEAYVSTRNAQQAARIAGYAHGEVGYQILKRPAVQDAIITATRARLVSEVAPACINEIMDTLQSATASKRDKLSAASLGLKYAMPLMTESGQVKDISEMTSAELQLHIVNLRREQEEREAQTKIIELAPNDAQDLPDFLQ